MGKGVEQEAYLSRQDIEFNWVHLYGWAVTILFIWKYILNLIFNLILI